MLAAAGAGLALALTRGHDPSPAAAGSAPPQTQPSSSAPATIRRRLAVRTAGRLPQAVSGAAAAAVGQRVYVLGGLTASDASTAAISSVRGNRSRTVGQLPVAVHDAAAAATPGGHVLLMGGGQTTSFSGVGSYDPASGRTRIVGRLPTPLSDLATAMVDGTVYTVGGFTGSAASDRVLRYRAGRATAVARLPHPVRYAAVAAQGSSLVIAGGRVGDSPSDAVYRFTPASATLRRIGTLPQPLMHAEAAQLDGIVYVVGGIGASGSPLSTVTAIDSGGRARVVADLPSPRSDAAVVASGGRLLVLGGSDGAHPLASILQIAWRRPQSRQQTSTAAPGTPPKGFRGPLPGDLLIADRGNDRLLLVDPHHRVLWRYPSRPGQHRLVFDDDAFFTPGGRSIISNEEDNQQIVQISYPGGRLVWSYGHAGVPGSGPGYLATPDDAYRLRGGMVVVSDDRNCRILELRGHHVVRSIGRPGNCVHDPPRGFASPNGDTPLPDGHLLVSEIGGSWVDELTLTGKLVRTLHVPVSYPSDPQLATDGNIVLADYSHPGGVVIVDRHSGRLLWSYRPRSGPGELDHPSLATMLPNGKLMVVDDYNNRVVVIDRRTRRIVWQYGRRGVGGTAHGYLHIPDGFDFVPVTADGRPDPAAIVHGP